MSRRCFPLLVLAQLALVVLAGTTACAPIRPQVYEAQTPSFDGAKLNSGVTSANIRSKGWRDKYNSLIATYGEDPFFKPALVKDQGVTPLPSGSFQVTEQARVNFIVMNTWRHDGTHTPPTLLQKVISL